MKKISYPLIVLLLSFLIFLPGCEVIGDIFQAGMIFGVIGVFLVIGLIIWVISKFRK